MWETRVWSLDREDPLEKKIATHFSNLAWRIPWRRSLVGYSPWGCKELDMTKRLHFLSCSFLEHLKENNFPCLLQLLEVAWTPWLVASASMFKEHHSNLSFHQHIPVLVSDLLSSYKAPCDDIGPIRIIQHNLLISKSLIISRKSLLSNKITHWQVPAIRIWTSLGDLSATERKAQKRKEWFWIF